MSTLDPWTGIDWTEGEERPTRTWVLCGDAEVHVGDKVVLRPAGRADIFDMALAGKTATVESFEQDFEDRVHVAVVVDDDPGRDLGMDRQPGHRFFFAVNEVEPLPGTARPRRPLEGRDG